MRGKGHHDLHANDIRHTNAHREKHTLMNTLTDTHSHTTYLQIHTLTNARQMLSLSVEHTHSLSACGFWAWNASMCCCVSGIGRHSCSACCRTWHNVIHMWLYVICLPHRSDVSQSAWKTAPKSPLFIEWRLNFHTLSLLEECQSSDSCEKTDPPTK